MDAPRPEGRVCGSCAAALPGDAAVCGRCGEPTAPPERRLVTLLFADLAGYTELCSRLDPEDVHNFVRPAMTALRHVVESFGGAVPQVQGDGFMAVFGAPVAHEDDAERAVRAALALVAKVEQLNATERLVPLPPLHIGINTGEVVVAPSREGISVAGDTVNVAARFCGLAAAGQVLAGERTRQLSGSVAQFGRRRLRRVRGRTELIPAYELLGVRDDARTVSRVPATHPFVGRREIRQRLGRELLAAMETGTSRLVAIEGEPGHGKSRLAQEFLAGLHGVTVLCGGSSPYGERLPLAPVAEAVAAVAGIRLPAPDAALEEGLLALATGWDVARPEAVVRRLAELLGGRVANRTAGEEGLLGDVMAIRALLEAGARRSPVVLALDDAHWADESTRELVRLLQVEPWNGPILVLVLARPDAGLPEGIERIDLPALEPAEMRELLASLAGGIPPEPATAELLQRAGGNPLFLEECVRMLVEEGGLRATGGVVEVDEPQIRGVPNSMRMFIAARLDGLAPAEKALLQDAAVAGEAVWDGLLRELAPDADVDALLASLEQRGLLRRRETSGVPGCAELDFKHALIRDVAYESLPRRHRAVRHERVAAWLGEVEARTEGFRAPLGVLAYHYHQAWLLARSETIGEQPSCDAARRAVDHLHRWGRRLYAFQARQAEVTFRQALEVAAAAIDCIDVAVRAELYVDRAQALNELARFTEALPEADMALTLAERADRPELAARALVATAAALSDTGRIDEAKVACERALAICEATGDVAGKAEVLYQSALNLRFEDIARDLVLLRQSYAAFGEAGDRAGQARAARDLAYIQTMEGGSEHARWYAVAGELTDRSVDLRSRADLTRTAAFLAWHRGEFGQALELARTTAADAVEAGARWVEADALLCQQACLSALGRLEPSEQLVGSLLAIAKQGGNRRVRAMTLAWGSRSAVRLRRPSVARERLAEAAALFEELRASIEPFEVDMLAVELAATTGHWADAEEPARRVSDGLGPLGWGLYTLPSRLSHARAALGAGAPDAVALLASAVDTARRHDVPRYGALAAACLEQAQLLAGDAAAPGLGTGPELAETLAVRAENEGLRLLRAGDEVGAAEAFDRAAAEWGGLGASVWLARALLWRSQAGADAEAEDVAGRLLADLEAPPGLAETFRLP